jgi:hypothetical protein
MEMDTSFLKVLVNPSGFFQDAITKNECLKIPALIVLMTAVVGAAGAYFIVTPTVTLMSDMLSGMGPVLILAAVAAAFVITLISWLVYAGIFYLVSIVFGGKGSFNRTLEMIGYGFLPQILGGLITLVVAMYYIPQVVVQAIPSGTQDSQVILDATTSLMQDPAMVALTQTITLISIVFLLWSANIWIFGVQYSRHLAVRDAALAVGLPVVLYIIYSIYKLGAL